MKATPLLMRAGLRVATAGAAAAYGGARYAAGGEAGPPGDQPIFPVPTEMPASAQLPVSADDIQRDAEGKLFIPDRGDGCEYEEYMRETFEGQEWVLIGDPGCELLWGYAPATGEVMAVPRVTGGPPGPAPLSVGATATPPAPARWPPARRVAGTRGTVLAATGPGSILYLPIPGLLDSAGIDWATLAGTPRAFTQLLSRADAEPFHAPGLLECVARLIPELPPECLNATAALRYLDDTGRAPTGYCLAADPAHFEVGREQIIMGRQGMDITPEETDALREQLGADIARLGARLEITRPDHWYLFPERPPEAQFATGRDLSGQGIRDHMPSGADAGPWRTLISDAQILLHDCNINRARGAQGTAPVNSLWLWGGGTLPKEVHIQAPWSAAASDDPIVRGLARMTGCPQVSATPEDFEAWIGQRANSGPVLIAVDTASDHPAQTDIEAWWQTVNDLDNRWLRPVMDALSRKQLSELILIPLNGQRYRVTRRLLRRWWKRSRRPSDFMDLPPSPSA